MFSFISFFQALGFAKRIYQGFKNSGEVVTISTTGTPGTVSLSSGLLAYVVSCPDLAGFVQRLGGRFEAVGVNSFFRVFALARAAHIYGVDFSKLYQYRNRF